MEGVVRLHRRAAERFGRVVDELQPGHLGLATPCTDWDARTLLNHNVAENLWVQPLMAGMTIAEVGDRFEGDVLGEDPAEAWRASANEACEALEQPGAMARTVELSFGATSAEEFASQRFVDLVVHAWDLASAIGADDELDDELVAGAMAWARPHEAMLASLPEYFSPPIAADEGDPPQVVLLKLFGRQP